MRNCKPIRQHGLTLFELLIVLAVLALAAAVAAPSLSGARRAAAAKTAAQGVYDALREARNAAVMSGRPVAVIFDQDEGRYGLSVENAGVKLSGFNQRSAGAGDLAPPQRSSASTARTSMDGNWRVLPRRTALVFEPVTESGNRVPPAILYYPDGSASGGEVFVYPVSAPRQDAAAPTARDARLDARPDAANRGGHSIRVGLNGRIQLAEEESKKQPPSQRSAAQSLSKERPED